MKEIKKKGRFKKVVKRIVTGMLIVAGVITALTIVLSVGTYLYNRSCLEKEAKRILHKGQYVEVDGHDMNLLIEGNGDKTLVFLAGAGTPSPILDFKPLTDNLKEDVKVVIIEKFGYGYSNEIDGDRTVDVITEQDREALLAAGVEGPYILCPHSASGFEAMYWANHYPDEVEAIIGLDMGIPEEYDYMGVDWESLQPEDPIETAKDTSFYDFWVYKVGLMRYMNAEEIFPALKSKYLTEDEKMEYRAIMYSKYRRGSDATINHEQWFTDRMIREMKALYDGPIPDVPTLMFVTDDKTLEPMVKDMDNWLLIHQNYMDNISDGKLVELNASHYFYTEIPEEVSTEIKEFIRTLEEDER
ncbi:MAG: alpha/beta hydrolase [Eubacterium sp.]|nr:alpha/beta hydrolase [Eubacterium sp.]